MTDSTESTLDDDSRTSTSQEERKWRPPQEVVTVSTTYETEEVDADVEDSAADRALKRSRRDPETSVSMSDTVEVDLADSAARLVRLMEAETAADATEPNPSETPAEAAAGADTLEAASPRPDERGLAGFQRWLTRTRQLGRRASQLLAAVDSINGPCERKQILADIVRLNLLLECNSAIGFNFDGTLRNTEDVAVVPTTDDGADKETDEKAAEPKPEAPATGKAANTTARELPDDAEVIMDKEELFGRPSGNVLLVFTSVLLVGSVFVSNFGPPDSQWFANWLLLVTATCCSLMISLAIFVRAGQRHRPLEAYREMGRELKNNRILISTIRGGGG